MEKVISNNHPCYSENAGNYARMHIPVAPACNISCNYCNRKYDCLHETRPGVTSEVLSPQEAFDKYKEVKEKVENLSVIGIAGPGDALANFPDVKESIKLIREDDPELIICLSTNGLNIPEYAEQVIELGVSHVTITINTIDPRIGAKIYKYVKYKGEYHFGIKGADILINKQLEGLKYLAEHGIQCKVNIVMIKGINELHIPVVVEKVKELGAIMTNIMPLIPAEGSDFADKPLVSKKELDNLRNDCSGIMKQMYHCQQCRADAIGQLTQDRSAEFRSCSSSKFSKTLEFLDIESITENENENENKNKDKEINNYHSDGYKIGNKSGGKYYFAVASKSGKIIDQHFGHVDKFYIYVYSNNGVKFIEKREVDNYCTGEECSDMQSKIDNIIEILSDCSAILTVRIGYEPKNKLNEAGIKTLDMYERIEEGIKLAVDKLDLRFKSVIG